VRDAQIILGLSSQRDDFDLGAPGKFGFGREPALHGIDIGFVALLPQELTGVSVIYE
jgi:hypothetical protein